VKAPLPELLAVAEIHRRLSHIFPEGIANRGYCTREIAAKTIYVMLYIGAIEGGVYLRPDQVTRMTDGQALKADEVSRRAWAEASLQKAGDIPGRWYAVNTREPIRDETLREGLIRTGAATVRTDLATTSSAPRYALVKSFAALLDPALTGQSLTDAIEAWQKENLTAGALARIRLAGAGASASVTGLMVTFPNGETRRLAQGPSSVIAKAVVEIFCIRFLENPGVIFLSESGNKVVQRDEDLARAVGLRIPADQYLPDILLVDLGPKTPLLIFVELVASDGPINAHRKSAFLQITRAAGFGDENVAFVTAYLDRGRPAFRKTVGELAWNSFAWFASEPEHIVVLREGRAESSKRLSALL
jgi:hypothetical protein